MSETIYDDGRYVVSSSIVATPTRFYPVFNTTAAIRRDPLWLGLALTGFVAGCVLTYGDLLYPGELMVMAGIAVLSLLTGWQVLILRLDAPGHRRALIVGPRGRIWKIFHAIRTVRAGQADGPFPLITED